MTYRCFQENLVNQFPGISTKHIAALEMISCLKGTPSGLFGFVEHAPRVIENERGFSSNLLLRKKAQCLTGNVAHC